MKVEHAAMYVTDLEKAKNFFVRYFEAIPGERYQNLTTGFCSYFLRFEDGTRLEIMHKEGLLPGAGAHMGFAHIAFSLGSKEAVDALTEVLRTDGYCVISGPRTTGDGYYESCILDGEGNQIELTV